jgi:hypothetical protein
VAGDQVAISVVILKPVIVSCLAVQWLRWYGGLLPCVFTKELGLYPMNNIGLNWVAKALPVGEEVYMMAVAAVCWAIWKAQNWTCFEKKKKPLGVLVI